jgi:hypothetical protein
MLLSCPFTLAQSHHGSAAMRAPTVRNSFRTPGRIGTALNPNFSPLHGVPGLGFDFQHLAIVNRPFRDRFGHEHRRGFEFITPIFDAGLPFYYSFDTGAPYYYTQDQTQPPQIIVPYPVPVTGQSPPVQTQADQSPPPPVPAAPVPELSQLILVRQDGQVLFAVAFTTLNGKLTYVTREGLKRSFPVDELDKSATRDMNDANGTSVALPE